MACFPAILSGGTLAIKVSFASLHVNTSEGSKVGKGDGVGSSRSYGSMGIGDDYGGSSTYGSN